MSPSTPTQASASDNTYMTPAGINKLLRRFVSTSSTTQANPPSATYEDKLGMSATELKTTVTMCGLTIDQEDILPEWMFKIAERGMKINTKNQIIIKATTGNSVRGCRYPCTGSYPGNDQKAQMAIR